MWISLVIVVLSFALVSSTSTDQEEAFETWKQKFFVSYLNNETEAEAFEKFCVNQKLIDEHNKLYESCNSSFSLGLWEKSDKSATELNGELNGLQMTLRGKSIFIHGFQIDDANVSFWNFAEMNYVTRVLNQGMCGSCWAFATTGALEGQIYKKYKRLVKLSEQQLVDCDDTNFGCDGGIMGSAYDYIKSNGIATYMNYPYEGSLSTSCDYNSGMMNVTVSDYIWQKIPNEKFLKNFLFSIGPLAVGLDASLFTFQSYQSGIYSDTQCSSFFVNHAMLLVGFGTDDRWGDYWILRNSYGKSWGESGYMRLKRGNNTCGITNYVVFPVV